MKRRTDTAGPGRGTAPVTLGLSIGDTLFLFVLAPVLGGGLGLALPWVARRAGDLPWVPFQGPLELLASMDARWVMAIGLVAGLVLGVALAIVTVSRAVRLTVAGNNITIAKGDTARRVARADVSAVFLDQKSLAVLDGASGEVVREEVDASRHRIEQAFRQHHYPWCAQDPHADAFACWAPGTPELPEAVHAILAAREKALGENDVEGAGDLRADLMSRGYVVREKATRQYWRAMR